MKIRQKHFWFNEPHDSPLPKGREIVVDCFAGGGGASVGLEWAIGRSVDVAINHNREAIAMHMANHPTTKHYCENLWDIDPVVVCEGRPVGAAWFSPDCTHFSKAKGKTPKKKEIRALAWIVLRWAARVKPRVIFLENVEEFVTWGPLKRGQPIKEKKGKTFEGWVHQLRELGYDVEWQSVVASDFGSPTTRKRLFLIARCDGKPIVWPEPTHGGPKQIAKQIKSQGYSRLKKWRTAADIIDWSIPCPSIFLTPEEAKEQGCRRPLAEKTMKRIAEGIRRYVIETNDPFIVKVNHGSEHFRGQPLDRPLSTITSANGYGVVTPYVSRMFGQSVGSSINVPIGALTQENKSCLVSPFIQALQHGGSSRRIDDPVHTITASTKDCNLVVAPSLVSYYGPKGEHHHRGRHLLEPLPTQTTENRFALVAPSLVQTGYGERPGQSPRCLNLHHPLGTVVAGGGKHALVSAFIAKHFGGMVGVRADVPFPTITTRGTQNQVVAVNMISGNQTTNRVEEVRAFLTTYYGNGGKTSLNRPVPTVTTKDRIALGIVLVSGQPFQIVDIGMRMLTPRELFAAQGFPDDYDIDTGLDGKPATKKTQVARCGNSVCPHPASVVVCANFRIKHVRSQVKVTA
ncbi:C-5 cytosine-specific DNA methylase [Thalassoglobus neptunius]|uniref:DNA (cytosine-5-)-methyltransferase n=1 Tax=Thalassoglobus neptunius TaxID=1938619 RepID=A0A5C5X784_9PLAN|nr:DNA cytosine methyltransferase [Thalassoglobus neptunius]TWT58977.1 C-5 cytosine-specific DNA methylase [Thalassoglobus neptunius]